jgi:Na+/proline symporter
LNWGSSYVVNDFYVRFINKEASDRKQVLVGRISTLLLMVLAAIFALMLSNALQAFNILLQIGAGTGLIFILRWFWWRINAWTEISGMVISFLVAIYFELIHPALGFGELASHFKLVAGVGITTIGWLIVTVLTAPEKEEVLLGFCKKINPTSGWKEYRSEGTEKGQLPLQILGMFLGCLAVYCFLFGTGAIIYGNMAMGLGLIGLASLCMFIIFRNWKKF